MASVRMPQLGESITEGTISKWLKQPGDQVKKYDSLVEIITDKVNAEVPSPFTGTLKEIKVPEGATVAVGTELAIIEEIPSPSTQQVPSPPKVKQSAPSPFTGEGRGGGASQQAEQGLGGIAGMIREPMAGPPRELTMSGAKAPGDTGSRLSPAVRALIDEHRLPAAEVAKITGSGIGGRISKKDVEDYVATRRQAKIPSPSTEEQPTPSPLTGEGRGGGVVPPKDQPIPLSPMRRAIAVNMTKSKQTIPHAWTVTEVDMTSVVRQRQRARNEFKQREGIDLTFVPIVIKGVVEALEATPILNASWADDHVVLHRDINIGLAVAIDDGLIVPVVRNADRLSIAGIARAADDLARRARAGKLTLTDVQGATFTVNNPGTFGTVLSYSIIAPPQAGILAMDAIIKRPVVVEGDAIAVRSMMNLCLSFDHRVLDGVSAASFLQRVRRFLEGFSEQVPLN